MGIRVGGEEFDAVLAAIATTLRNNQRHWHYYATDLMETQIDTTRPHLHFISLVNLKLIFFKEGRRVQFMPKDGIPKTLID